MNLYYEKIYPTLYNEEDILYFNDILDVLNIDKNKFFIHRFSIASFHIMSKKNKNFFFRIRTEDEECSVECIELIYSPNPSHFIYDHTIFEHLNSFEFFRNERPLLLLKKKLSFDETLIENETLSLYKNNYNSAVNAHRYTKEEVLSTCVSEYHITKNFDVRSQYLILKTIFNRFIKINFNVKASDSAFNHIYNEYPDIYSGFRRNPSVSSVFHLKEIKEVLFFTSSGDLTEDSKDLLSLNFNN